MKTIQDIRMKGFERKISLKKAIEKIKERTSALGAEEISFEDASQRVIAEDIISDNNFPSFERAAMDGYALMAKDTFGATTTNFLVFGLKGEVFAGNPKDVAISENEAVKIATGAAMPKNADAVIMAEYTDEDNGKVKVFASVTPGKNVHLVGEDLKIGDRAIKKGTLLKPQHIGVLAMLKKTKIKVYKKPRASVIITGDEIVSPYEKVSGQKIVDANTYILNSLLKESNCEVAEKIIVKDNPGEIEKAMLSSKGSLVLVTGGTAVGEKDYTPLILQKNGELIFHGVAIRPGAPTGFGILQDKIVFLLPGNPAGAMIAFEALVKPAIHLMQGTEIPDKNKKISAKLNRKIPSQAGRMDFVRVKIEKSGAEPLRSSGSGILSSMTRSDGFVIIPEDKDGLAEGEDVEVNLF